MNIRGGRTARLQDELTSTGATVRSVAPQSVLVAHIVANVATRFTSPITGQTSRRSGHKPPTSALAGEGAWGFDARLVTALVVANDGSDVQPAHAEAWFSSYSAAVRAAAAYDDRFEASGSAGTS